LSTFYESITDGLQGLYERARDSHGMLVLELAPSSLAAVVDRLKTDFGFALFLDVTAVDYPERVPRFEVVYHFLSPARMQRVRLKLTVDEHAAELPTLTHLYGSARYMEREVHEMYGIRFAGNADLRPILLYEGFEGHPLRKDYAMEHEQPIVPYRK
jgi:NADH-quinone oxidoreductase subunit C